MKRTFAILAVLLVAGTAGAPPPPGQQHWPANRVWMESLSKNLEDAQQQGDLGGSLENVTVAQLLAITCDAGAAGQQRWVTDSDNCADDVTPTGVVCTCTGSAWEPPPGAAGGEANITANAGGGPVSLRAAAPKTGVALNLRTLSSDFAEAGDLISFATPHTTDTGPGPDCADPEIQYGDASCVDLATDLGTPTTVNEVGDLLSWWNLKDVPAGFADGTDDGGGGGAPSDADYWVGTANGSLSAEIVVDSLSALNTAIGASIADGAHTTDTTCLDAGVNCLFAGSASEGGAATTAINATNAANLDTGGLAQADDINGALCNNGEILKNNAGTWECATDSTGGTPAFSDIATGTNTTATMTVGAGASIVTSGGTIAATTAVNATNAANVDANGIDAAADLATTLCADTQILKKAGGVWVCGTDIDTDTDTFSTIEVDGTPVSTNAPTLNFNDADFNLTQSPTDDFAISIDTTTWATDSEVTSEIATHAGLPNVHHTPPTTCDTGNCTLGASDVIDLEAVTLTNIADNEVLVGTAPGTGFFTALPNCATENDVLGWDPAAGGGNGAFVCTADAGAGGGMTSWTIGDDNSPTGDLVVNDGETVQIIGGTALTSTIGGTGSAPTITLDCTDAAADGSTKGCASFDATHFDATAGNITIASVAGVAGADEDDVTAGDITAVNGVLESGTQNDNEIARWDSVANTIQGSSCTISDTGVIDCPASATEGGSITLKEQTGNGDHTFKLKIADGNALAANRTTIWTEAAMQQCGASADGEAGALSVDSSGQIVCTADGGGGGFTSFFVEDDTPGAPEEITDGQTLTVAGGTGISTSVGATDTVTLSTVDGEINHDALLNFSANEHVDHTGVTLTAGAGLTGTGDISASRTFDVGAGTGIAVGTDDVSVDQTTAFNWTGLHTMTPSGAGSQAAVTFENDSCILFSGATPGDNLSIKLCPDATPAGNHVLTLPADDGPLLTAASLVTPSWDNITSGTNSAQGTFAMGAGSFLRPAGGQVEANELDAGTFAQLPISPTAGDVFVVTNAPSAGDCSAGGGSSLALCRYSGSGWVALGDGGGGAGDVASDAIWDALGDLAVGTGADTALRLPAGANGQTLIADDGQATGLLWTNTMPSKMTWNLAAGEGQRAIELGVPADGPGTDSAFIILKPLTSQEWEINANNAATLAVSRTHATNSIASFRNTGAGDISLNVGNLTDAVGSVLLTGDTTGTGTVKADDFTCRTAACLGTDAVIMSEVSSALGAGTGVVANGDALDVDLTELTTGATFGDNTQAAVTITGDPTGTLNPQIIFKDDRIEFGNTNFITLNAANATYISQGNGYAIDDTGAADQEGDIQWSGNCTNDGSGVEDCDFRFDTLSNGLAVNPIRFDGDEGAGTNALVLDADAIRLTADIASGIQITNAPAAPANNAGLLFRDAAGMVTSKFTYQTGPPEHLNMPMLHLEGATPRLDFGTTLPGPAVSAAGRVEASCTDTNNCDVSFQGWDEGALATFLNFDGDTSNVDVTGKLNATGDLASAAKLQLGSLTVGSASCVAIDADRPYADKDCSGTKGGGEEYLDIVGGGQTLFFKVTDSPYSAACDGTTDDTAAIESAINDASAAGGGVVFIPGSTGGCAVDGVDLKSNVTIIGAGQGAKGLIAKATVSQNGLLQFNQAAGGLSNVTVRELTLDGDSKVTSGIHITQDGTTSGSNLNFRSLLIKNVAGGAGLRVWSLGATNPLWSNVVVRDVKVSGSSTNGPMRFWRLTDSVIMNNDITNTTATYGLDIRDSTNVLVSNNKIKAGNTAALYAAVTTDLQVIGNLIDANAIAGAVDGLRVETGLDAQIVNNRIKPSGLCSGPTGVCRAIVITNASNRAVVTGNVISAPGAQHASAVSTGIWVGGSSITVQVARNSIQFAVNSAGTNNAVHADAAPADLVVANNRFAFEDTAINGAAAAAFGNTCAGFFVSAPEPCGNGPWNAEFFGWDGSGYAARKLIQVAASGLTLDYTDAIDIASTKTDTITLDNLPASAIAADVVLFRNASGGGLRSSATATLSTILQERGEWVLLYSNPGSQPDDGDCFINDGAAVSPTAGTCDSTFAIAKTTVLPIAAQTTIQNVTCVAIADVGNWSGKSVNIEFVELAAGEDLDDKATPQQTRTITATQMTGRYARFAVPGFVSFTTQAATTGLGIRVGTASNGSYQMPISCSLRYTRAAL